MPAAAWWLPNEASIIRLIGAVLLEQNDEWQHRYMQVEAMTEFLTPAKPRPDRSRRRHNHVSDRLRRAKALCPTLDRGVAVKSWSRAAATGPQYPSVVGPTGSDQQDATNPNRSAPTGGTNSR